MAIAFKHTLLMQLASQTTGPGLIRVGGWSESFYKDVSSPTSLDRLALARATLLPDIGNVVGLRIQQVNPAGKANTFVRSLPGNQNFLTDIPQMALLCSARAINGLNTRSITIRGIPDSQVVTGEWQPFPNYKALMEAYLLLLKTDAWQFRAVQKDAPLFAVNEIIPVPMSPTNNATVSALQSIPGGFVPNEAAVLIKAQLEDGRFVGGKFIIDGVNSGTNVMTIRQWPFAEAKGGKFRLYSLIFPVIGDTGISRAIVRKVGRPFTSYRGRQSKRKRRQTA